MTIRYILLLLRSVTRAGIMISGAVLLGACATPELTTSGDSVEILDLRCNSDKSVAATAWARIPGTVLETGGAILHSPDGGLTWSITAGGDNLRGVAPRFFDDSRNGSAVTRPLIVTGYKSGGGLNWTYYLAGWMKSMDSGRTWVAIPDPLPAVGDRDPIGWPPPLVVVNATGRLATLRRAPSPTLLISDDRGKTWSEVQLPVSGYFDRLHLLRSDGHGRLIVVGESSSPLKGLGVNRTVVIQSGDSGKTWSVAMDEYAPGSCIPRMIGTPDGAMLINIPCPGSDRRYFFSSDGGRTWQGRSFYRRAYGTFEQVIALDGKRWLALSKEKKESSGFSLVAWISDDGGSSWRGNATGFAVLSGNPHLMEQSIVPLPGGVIVAYVSDGQVLRSTDRGESWKLIDTGLPRNGRYYLGASCTDGHGLVVLGGDQGMVVRSVDGGLTWERGQLPRMTP